MDEYREEYLNDFQKSSNNSCNCNIYNPFSMKGMERALNRIIKAINTREKIVVYGYYDVDGITAISMIILLLKYLNADVEYFIPSDVHSTHDLNIDDIEGSIKYLGADLIITLGCGINSAYEVDVCKQLGMDIIITDYHVPSGYKPNTIVINPSQEGCEYPFKELSGVGVAYKLVQAIASYYRLTSTTKYLDLVMLGTISNKVSLSDENKIIVEQGIKQLECTNNHGIKALIQIHDIKNINAVTASKLAFTIIPTINPVGRMDNAKIVVELFTTRDSYRAKQIAKYLDNEIRMSLQ